MLSSIYVPPMGTLDYCPQIGVYTASNVLCGLGPISVSLKAENIEVAKSCVERVQQIILCATGLNRRARDLLIEKTGDKAAFLQLSSIDCYVNGEFDLFYLCTEKQLSWALVSFSKDMHPIQIEFDL